MSNREDAGEDADWQKQDLSDLDFSYEPQFERLGHRNASPSLGPAEAEKAERTFDSMRPSSSAHNRSNLHDRSDVQPRLTHIDPADGSRARMVDVSNKASTLRTGVAVGRVYLPQVALDLIRSSEGDGREGPVAARPKATGKGPVLRTAQLAGIMGAKRTAELIPLCHPLPLSHVDVTLELVDLNPAEDSAEARRKAEEFDALAASQSFLDHATGRTRTQSWDDAPESGGEDTSRPEVGFRIEDLIDGDRWSGRELDLSGSGAGSSISFERPSLAQLRSAQVDNGNPSSHIASSRKDRSDLEDTQEADLAAAGYVQVTCTARTTGPTGVEMEALVGANVACLTVWDMVKAVAGREMWIGDVKVIKKTGGKSGDWEREV